VPVAAYVYPGWHAIPERTIAFAEAGLGPTLAASDGAPEGAPPRAFTEWDLVRSCGPRFPGHAQPHVPLWGEYDDRDPREVGRRVSLAAAHGIDAFVHGLFWCRGKRVFEAALDDGFLGSDEGRRFPFALMWANRMPRRVLPVRRADVPVIEADRLVPSDVADFVRLMTLVGERYMTRPNYLRVLGRPYFSIFDSTFFLRELGLQTATHAIRAARERLASLGLPGLHLAAIEPSAEALPLVRAAGFDSVTHYVLLPDWKGPYQQDYATMAARRALEWEGFARASGLPYHPSVAPGWDATPRGVDFGPARPDRYPWSPVVTGDAPAHFREALVRALRFTQRTRPPGDLTFVASWNEWSEGHHVEPDARLGLGRLEAIRDARREAGEG